MPVTAKLSRKFYERLGDDIAGELVDWFNAVDLTYQNQLRELNEMNWERFKATLLAETASIRAESRTGLSEMAGTLRSEIAELAGDLRTEMARMDAGLRSDMGKMEGGLRKDMSDMRAELMRWMFVYWCTSLIGLGGLVAGMAFFGPR